ncbi:MAG: hypothetical protein JSS72_02465 [Armatimonadetes bacterium]|nr:hypothetical protein [Armatimonadota bacterium]
MSEVIQLWAQALPEIRKEVAGVGVWTALNTAKPLVLENDVVVLGLPHGQNALVGHLRVSATKRAMDQHLTRVAGKPTVARVIEGDSEHDWEMVKRRDEAAQKLQEQAMVKMRAELEARTNWESVYEQLSRRYAAIQNKSLPQNRARFFEEAVELIAEARKGQPNWDDLQERNFARCLERIGQYTDLPTTLVATIVLQRAGEL